MRDSGNDGRCYASRPCAGRRVLQRRATLVRPRWGATHNSVPVTRFTCSDPSYGAVSRSLDSERASAHDPVRWWASSRPVW